MAGTTNQNRRVNARSGQNRRVRPEYYVDGTGARVLEPRPHPDRRKKRTRQTSSRVRENRARAKSLGIGYVFFLLAASALVVFSCINYLQVKSAYTRQTQKIAYLESSLSRLKEDNDAFYKQTVDSLDMDDVKETALEDLGMHYADESQIHYYNMTEESYVRQFRDVSEK